MAVISIDVNVFDLAIETLDMVFVFLFQLLFFSILSVVYTSISLFQTQKVLI